MQYALLLLAVFAGSTAVVFIRESQIDAALLAGLRLIFAAVVLTPVYLRDLRRHGGFCWRRTAASAAPGVLLAVHLITWNIGARLALAANATLIVNLVPLVMPLLLATLASERLNHTEVIATVVATLGIGLMLVTDFQASREHFLGDVVCLGSMCLLALYLTLGRRHRSQPTVWLYMTPLFYAAGLTGLATAVVLGRDLSVDWSIEWRWVGALVFVPTLLGHTLVNNAMRYFRGQLVGIAMMGQFVFAGVLAYFCYDELPSWSFYVSAVLAVTGAAIAVRGHHVASRSAVLSTTQPGPGS